MSGWRRAARAGLAALVGSQTGRAFLRRRFPDLVVIFLWHGIGERAVQEDVHLFFDQDDLASERSSFCPPATFERQLDDITAHFRVVSLEQAIAHLQSDGGFGHLAALTFDDGMGSVCDCAAPILVRRGLPACLFVNAALAGGWRLKATDILNFAINRAGLSRVAHLCAEHGVADAREASVRWHQRPIISGPAWRRLKTALLDEVGEDEAALAARTRAYATWADLAALPRRFFSFGNHGVEHLHLPHLTRDEIAREIQAGAATIRDHLGVERMPYAYTFGAVTDVTEDALAIARPLHTAVLSAFGGFNLPGPSLGTLARVPVFSTPDPALLLEYAFPARMLARAIVRGHA